jgi:hypothetical protein
VGDLKPESQIALNTNVCFSHPGIYNINRYKFSVQKDEKRKASQEIYSNYQHMIIIEDQNA